MSEIYDAVGIENAFARIVGNEIGERGTEHDADFFRNGDPKKISKALKIAISAIEERLAKIELTSSDHEAGGIGAQLDVAVGRLNKIAINMAGSTKKEPNDYHWVIVASLLTIINTLLIVLDRTK
ncbi:hypothetical protein [Marinomonas primoryensis]|uniref:Uncharacterized protein n=1 Tax=Marinomonas primoryensis TaxID=178399 RepID=A0ABV0L7P9_9GAMM